MPLANTAIVGSLFPALVRSGFFPLTVTFKLHDGTVDGFNQPDYSAANWDNVSGLVDLNARITPVPLFTREKRTGDMIQTLATHVLLLAGRYDLITVLMRVQIGSSLWKIEAVEGDGQEVFTRLRLYEVTT